MWTGTPSKNRDYERDWEDIWGTVLQVYLGICILGWVLVIILNIIEMLNKQGI